MLKKKPALVLTLGAAIALIVGGGIAYWFVASRRPLARDLPVGANLIPQNALMTLSFSTDEAQWNQLKTLGTPEMQALLDKNLTDLRDRLLTENGYTYAEDIQPWIGDEVTVAFLSDVASPSATPDPEAPPALPQGDQAMVWILPIDDLMQAQATLASPGEGGPESTTRDYNGLEVREFSGEDGRNYAATVIDRQLLVMTDTPKAIEGVIDTYKGQSSVLELPGYRQALHDIADSQSFLQVYVNVPVASQLSSENVEQPIPPQGLVPLQDNQGFAATVIVEDNGVEIKGITWQAPDNPLPETVHSGQTAARQLPTRLPADTLMMVSGGNLQQMWQNYSARNQEGSSSPFDPEAIRAGFQGTTGLNLDEDVLSWMGGEFALSLLPTTDASPTGSGVGAMFLVQVSDRPAAEETLATLDDLMANRYRFGVNETQIEGRDVIQWTQPLTGISLARGWLDNDIAFLAFGAVTEGLLPEPAQPLAGDDLFQQVTVSELNSTNGYFFANLEQIRNGSLDLPLPDLPPNNQTVVDAIRAIGITASAQEPTSNRFDISVVLQKTADSTASP